MTLRCGGIADRDPAVVADVVARAEALGLRTVAAPTVAVAFGNDRVGVARADDGSFLVLDGESFPVGTPDEMAARVLDAVRAGRNDVAFEGMATWWDARRGEVSLFPDQVGTAPAMWGRAGPSLVWSSHPHDLLALGVAPEADPDAMALLAALGFVPPPVWFLRGTGAVPPGRMLRARPGGEPSLVTWWIHRSTPATEGDADAQADVIGAALVRAVEERLGGGRLGMFLSGGIDSTSIAMVLRRILDVPVETFTFRYLGYEGKHNEDEFAAETARQLGAPHTTIPIGADELAARFSDIVRDYGTPLTFGVHSFKQEPVRDAGIEVMLAGVDAGGWYPYARLGSIAARLWKLPPGARVRAQYVASRLQRVPKVRAAYWAALLANNGIDNEYLPPSVRRELVGRDAVESAARRTSEALGRFAVDLAAEPAAHRATLATEIIVLYDAEWNRRWARIFGYPIRQPFFDPAMALAIDRRRPWDDGKAPLRRFVARYLDHERAYAPKIHQEMPLAQWLRGPLRDLAHDVLSRERVDRAGVFAHEPVQRLLDEHERGVDRRWPLWQLMTAVEWALQLRDGAGDAPPLAPRH